ncbi:MAG TPA: site-specific integrase, partial [Verrucomicrobiota bacterium]|nr:site-specific integrase [Verrucomicrobiota bacterium]
LPVLVLGAFCGLRSAEIERLEWADIDLQAGVVVVGADKSKTASRRVVPMPDNARIWLAPYAGRTGRVWPHEGWRMYRRVTETVRAAGVKPQANALRHSFATYKFALTGDAGRVAGELGNSAGVLHRHYRNLAKPDEGKSFFELMPPGQANVVPLAAGNQ